MVDKDKFKQTNQSLGQHLGIGSFSAGQLLWSGSVFIITLLISHALLGLSIYIGVLLSSWLGLTVAFLSGNKPYKFWSLLFPFTIPNWIRGQSRQISPVSRERLGARKVKVARNTSEHLNPIEDWLHLLTLCRIELNRKPSIACYLLGGNEKHTDLSKLFIKFGFNLEGINPCIASEQELSEVITRLETLFKDIDTSFTFRWRSFCDYADEPCGIQERLHNPVSTECCYLDHASIARTKELVKHKKRKAVSLSVEVTYKPHLVTQQHRDWLDKWIERIKSFWQRKIENKGRCLDEQQLIFLLREAYDAALRYHQVLSEAGLKPKFQSEIELWQELRRRMGADKAPLPSVLVLDHNGLHEQFPSQAGVKQYTAASAIITQNWHISTKLVQDGVPFADRRWICVPSSNGKHKYIGLLILEEKCAGFFGDEGQLLYWWKVLGRDNIYDVELVTELSPADSNLVRISQQFLTRNSISRDEQAQVKGTVEVGAQLNLENSIEAQRQLLTGDVPLYTSVVVLIYRDSPQELDEVCRNLSGLIKQPAKLNRELDYSWLIWLQTTGLRKEALLGAPYFRRLMFFASEVLGACNLVQVPCADTQGIELIANKGGTSVRLDFSAPKNLLVLGTTGSGKSVLVASFIAECLACGMPFVAIDLPNADGSGTFHDLNHFFGGFYFDISREANNIMQPLNLAHIADEGEREWRRQTHRSDVILIVSQLVLGTDNSLSGFLIQTIESLIPLIITAFYGDTEIQARFALAEQEGFGSSAWNNTPTLRDLVQFVSPEFIDLGYQDNNLQQALNHITLRLQYWINSPLGKAIAQPTSFDLSVSKSKLITFALTNLQTNEEAAIFGMSALLAASAQTLSSPSSAFFMDEASVLLGFPALARLVGRKFATGRKAGCRTILAGQDINSIADCIAGEKILQNAACRLIGRIEPTALNSFQEILKIPQDIISQNVSFQANKFEGYTRWLLDYQNTYIQCRYYPSYPLLALTANNPEERSMREKFKAKYRNKLEYLTHFYRYYKQQLKQGGIK